MMSAMRVLITGGAGFIGSNLARRLASSGHSIVVLDNLSPQIHGDDPARTSPLFASLGKDIDFVQGSVCDPLVLEECLSRVDAVVHLAAETGTGQSMYEINRYTEVNVGGTALMLDWLANHTHSVRRLVVASSRAIYGEGRYRDPSGAIVYPRARNLADLAAGRFELLCQASGEPLQLLSTHEESKIHPTSVYGITKHTQEQLVMTVCPAIGIEGVALRYQNVYGPGQSLKNPYTGILSIFSTRLLNGNPIQIFEDGRESRDFIYIDDVVDATALALERAEAAGEVFGIGSGVATDVLTVARHLVECFGSEVPVQVTGAFRVGDIRHNYADPSKAQTVLGFQPRVCFQDGIRAFANWVTSQDVPTDHFDRSLREMSERGMLKR